MDHDIKAIQSKIRIITALAILGGLMIPSVWIGEHLLPFALVLILFGVPHGASDYLIFQKVFKTDLCRAGKRQFAIYYFVTMAIYGVIWWMFPSLAFGIFLLISVYHFGQSNWQNISFSGKSGLKEMATILLWGSAIIGVPVLLHDEQASLIIYEITGQYWDLNLIRRPAIFLLIGANLINMVNLLDDGHLTKAEFERELFNFCLLMGLFFTTPLLIGFAVYFVFWHSIGSMIDQINIFRSLDEKYQAVNYLSQVVVLSLLSLAGLGALYYFLGNSMDQGINLGVFFLFISIITVPHSILMDRLYALDSFSTKNMERTEF